MKLLKSIPVLGIAILFYACSGSKAVHKTDDKTVVVTPPSGMVLQVDPHLQNGKTITLKVNDRFDVVFLRECIGCAEVWRVVSIDKDKIGQMESTYKNGPAPGTMGGSQDHIFHFMAKDKGTSTLSFSYFKETSTITFIVN